MPKRMNLHCRSTCNNDNDNHDHLNNENKHQMTSISFMVGKRFILFKRFVHALPTNITKTTNFKNILQKLNQSQPTSYGMSRRSQPILPISSKTCEFLEYERDMVALFFVRCFSTSLFSLFMTLA